MSTINQKIKVLRNNKGWTQVQLAEKLNLSESAIQKWEVEKNTPPLAEIKRMSVLFDIPASALIDDSIDIPEFFLIDTVPTVALKEQRAWEDSSDHEIFDAGLSNEAKLHRFLNKAGVALSAIFRCGMEIMFCERDREQAMINYWNTEMN